MPKAVLGGRKPSHVWNSFVQVGQEPDLKFQCTGCSKVVCMKCLRSDHLTEHLKACKSSSQRSNGPLPGPVPDAESEPDNEVANIMEGDQDHVPDARSGANSESPFAPISIGFVSPSPVSPVPSMASGSSAPAKRPRTSPSPSSSRSSPFDGNFIRTTEMDKDKIRDAWAKFFFKNRLSFNLADDPTFREALDVTRPNINGDNGKKPLLTRKMLSGNLLDEAEVTCSAKLASLLEGKYAVLSQDGWTDVHQEPVIAASLHCNHKTYPLDFESTGAILLH